MTVILLDSKSMFNLLWITIMPRMSNGGEVMI